MKKNLLLKTVFLLLVNIVFLSGLKATTYYVSPTGDDTWSGTRTDSAWQTIANINSMNIQPGDSILFEGGQTFTGNIYLDETDANSSSSVVNFSSYGTGKATISADNSYGFFAYNTQGIHISNLIFDGSGMLTNTDNGIIFYADLPGDVKLSNVKIYNVEIKNFGSTGITIGAYNGNTGYKDVTIDSVHVHHVYENGIVSYGFFDQANIGWAHQNMLIQNTLVDSVPGYSASGHRGSGIIMSDVDSGIMQHCVAHDNGTGNTHCGGPGGIWAWDCNNVTIQFCEAYRNSSGTGCDGLGFDFDGGVTNSVIQYNYSHDNDGAGYLLGQFDYARPWFNNILRYNISQNDSRTNGGAIELFKGPGTTMTGAQIYNNTIYTTPSVNNPTISAFTFVDWITGIDSTVVYNNIFQTTGDVPLIDIPVGYDAYFAGNLYSASGGAFKIQYQGTLYNDLVTWRTATSNEMIGATATGMIANPMLTNAGSGGTVYPAFPDQLDAYKLPVGSPAINTGLNLAISFGINSGNHDFFNNPAPYGGASDIGAFESSVVSVVGTNHTIENKISSYPNPVRSGNNIQLIAADIISSVELMDATGVSLWKKENINANSQIISTKNFGSGIYFIRVVSNEGNQAVQKLVIQ